MTKSNFDPLGTLSIGNVVTTGTTIYKSNFKRYFQVSLRATGWLIAIVFLIIGLAIVGGFLFGITSSWLATIPVWLGGVVAILYFSAKYATNRAVISRLAYQEMIDAPESVAVATQQLAPKTWGFLRLSWLVSFYLFLVAVISYIILAMLMFGIVGGLTYVFKLSMGSPNVFVLLCIGLLTIGLVLLWIVVLIRYYAYWFVSELPLAIEQTRSANFSIDRSTQLSKIATRRIILIIMMAFLITLPLSLLSNGPGFVGQIMTSSSTTDPTAQALGGLLVLVGFFLNLLSELFVMPFWQIIKAIVYYDLRNRREGRDLIL